MENNEWMERKALALAVLRERLAGARERLRAIDDRLLLYFDDLATHASADPEDADDRHNLYEVLCGVKFLRLLATYDFNDKKVQTVIRLREAMADAQAKYNENRPLEERIADFNREFPYRDVKVEAARLFEWHHILTGSCLAGRKAFCEEHGLDYEHGHYTVNELISLTREAYGGEAIQELERTLS